MIDSHAHVAFAQFDADRDEVIARAREVGVHWIEVGTDIESSRRAIEVGEWCSVGVHPSDVASGVDWKETKRLLEVPNVVAVGEVGIDLYHQNNLGQQLEALEKFVVLAKQKNLPVIFHVRSGEQDAHAAMIDFLQKTWGASPAKPWRSGVIHTFSGTLEQAKQYLELGLHLSFSGVVTFPNAGEITEVAKTAPLERILIETDCPFLAPQPVRGKRNEPAYVRHVAQKIAELRGMSFAEIERATEENTRRLFRLR